MTSVTNTQNTSKAATPQVKYSTQAEHNNMNFLSLLTAQLTQQDPLEPLKNEEMMNQIVGMQTMEGLESLRASIESLSRQRNVRAADLLGTTVELNDQNSKVVGKVDSVKFMGDTSEVVVNGKSYPESAIVSVRQS